MKPAIVSVSATFCYSVLVEEGHHLSYTSDILVPHYTLQITLTMPLVDKLEILDIAQEEMSSNE